MLKVWGRKTSVNVQKVMWAVAELGLAHERIDAGGPFGVVDTPGFAALNPNRLVPVIEDGDFLLWESNAIVRYLADTYGRGSLAPEGRYAFAHADQWIEWGSSMLYSDIISTAFIALVRTPARDRNASALAAAAKRAGERLAILDRHLEARHFIGGDKLSMADVAVGTLMYRYFTLEIERPRLPHVEAWYQRLAARQAYQDHVMIDINQLKVPGA